MRLNLPNDYSEHEKNMYLESVEFAKKFYGDRAFRVDHEKFYRGAGRLTMLHFMQKKSIGQQLVKYVINDTCALKIPSSFDVITAFYIPEDVKISLKANDDTIAEFFQEYPIQDLQDVLDESWTIPKEISLEQLLEISNIGNTGFIYNQDPEITIGGCKYIRTLLLHPFIPYSSAMLWVSLELQASEPCDVYIEMNMLHAELRRMIEKTPWMLWSDLCGTVLVKNGCIGHFLSDKSPTVDLHNPIVPSIDIPVHDVDNPSPCITEP